MPAKIELRMVMKRSSPSPSSASCRSASRKVPICVVDTLMNSARGYAQPYRASGKPVVLIGIAFDKEKRTIGDWKSEHESPESH